MSLATACGDDGGSDDAADTTAGTTGTATGTTAPTGTADDSTGGVVTIDEQPGCDPLVPEVCAYPFPSMRQLTEDASTATGHRVALTPEVVPSNASDVGGIVDWLGESDGFPRSTRFVALFAEQALDRSNFPDPLTLEQSLEATSPVQVFDLATGERVPVWADVELRGTTPAEQPLVIRPMIGLPPGSRVAVVITDALHYADGSVPTSSPAFAALRDGVPTDSDSVEAQRADFDAMFATVEAAGVPRSSIVLAWEAVIASREVGQQPLPAVIAAASEALAAAAPTYTISSCKSDEMADVMSLGCTMPGGMDAHTWRRVFGTVEFPNYLGADGRIALDDDGVPVQNGTFTAEFVVNIPQSLKAAAPGDALLVEFGHGLLAEPADYIDDDGNVHGQVELADEMGAIFVGTRWSGLSSTDLATAAALVEDLNGAPAFHDLLVQGITNQAMMIPFARDVLAADPLLATADGAGSLVDPDKVGYTGISQGGIFGTTLMAVSPDVQTGVLHVPSSGYNHLLPFSPLFASFQTLLDISLPDLHEQQIFFALAQRMFDGGDPINFAEDLVTNPATPLGAKNVLFQCSIGDTVAPWFGCDMLVRTAGVPELMPSVRPVFGLATLDAPSAAGSSALQYYDAQLGDPPLRNDMLEDVGAHGGIRRNEQVHLQTIDFLDPGAPGTATNHCGGPCVIDSVPTGG